MNVKKKLPSITLDDVAHAAGLSRAQVSRALRGDPGVRDETRREVRKIASRMGYVPNLAARSLASSSHANIGILIGEPQNPFQLKLANALDAALAEAGLDATVSLRGQSDQSAERETERMRGMRVAGLILVAVPRSADSVRRIAQHIPTVFIGEQIVGERLSSIWPENKQGIRAVVEHLISLGHKRIAFIGGNDNPSAEGRLASYLTTIGEAGLVPIVAQGNHTFRCGREATNLLLERRPAPTAICAGNDFSAIGVMSRLHELGLRVPADISVTGFDDIAFADSTHFGLTTVRQDVEQQAALAVTEIQRLIGDPQARGVGYTQPVSFLVRRTVGPCPRN